MATKITKREQFVAIAEMLGTVAGAEDKVEFIEAQIALLDKRAAAPRKATPGQVENEALKENIVEILTEVGPSTATGVGEALDVSVQKATQLLKQLVDAGVVARTDAKGKEKATFAVA